MMDGSLIEHWFEPCGPQAVLDAFAADDVDAFQPDAGFMDAMKRIVQDRVTEDLSLTLAACGMADIWI